VTYIASLGGARWENWRNDLVIASAEVNDRLALPSDGPRLDRKQWRVKPCLVLEFEPILDRIKELAVGGLTSMHVLGDFLKRRVMPLQGRPRLCCWFTGPSDIGRIQRGPGTKLSWEQLEILVRGITSEAFIAETLIPPQGILQSVVLARLPTLDESGVAIHQTGGRDPHRGIHIPGAPVGGPQPADVGPRAPLAAPSSSDKGKGYASSSSTPDVAERSEELRQHRLYRADGSFVSDLPLDSDSPQKCQKTAGGTKEAEPRVQDGQRGVSPPPPPPSDPTPPLPRPVSNQPPSPRGSSSNSSRNGSSSRNDSGRPASKATGRFMVSSNVFSSVAFMPTGLDPSFARQGLPFFIFRGRSSPAGRYAHQWVWFPASYICWECRR
jgi:hypothetical protein